MLRWSLRSLSLAAVVLTGGAAVLAAPAAAIVPEAVLATPRSEVRPAAAPGYLAWTQDSRARPGWHNVFVKPDGEARYRVNPKRTRGAIFGGAIDGTTLVYAQLRPRSANGDLKLFDLVTRKRSAPPAGINTKRSEDGATLSGDWLLYRRTTRSTSTERILLHNLVTHEERRLDVTKGRRYAQPGNVAGNYAAWFRCRTWKRCDTYVYEIAARTATRLGNPLGRAQYAPSVTADGTVFLFEGVNILCENVRARLFRYLPGEARELLATLPRNRDPAISSALVHGDRYHCRTLSSDLYKLEVPAPTSG